MDHQQEIFDLSIVFTQPPPGSLPEILAQVAVQCDGEHSKAGAGWPVLRSLPFEQFFRSVREARKAESASLLFELSPQFGMLSWK